MSCELVEVGAGDADRFYLDWTAWLAVKTDEYGSAVSIASATWAATGAASIAASTFAGSITEVAFEVASAAVEGERPTLACTVTTSAGHRRTATVGLVVVAR